MSVADDLTPPMLHESRPPAIRGRQSTYCHACGTRTIGRDWYELSDWRLDNRGACIACGTPTAGVFDGPPGDWGRKRRPVRLDRC